MWDSKDLTQKDIKSLRVNIEFDHPTFVKWSPDSKAFIIHKFNENAIEVYKIEKKKDGWLGHATKALTFPKVKLKPTEILFGCGLPLSTIPIHYFCFKQKLSVNINFSQGRRCIT